MRSLVVYYSRSGTTKKAATAFSRVLGSDIEEIIDLKNRKGVIGWLSAGKDANLKKLTEIKKTKKDPSKYKLIVIGTPVWAFTLTPAIRTFIAKKCRKLRKVAFFCTNDGSPGNTFKAMKELCGKSPVAALSLKRFEMHNGDYYEKIKKFALKLKKRG